MTFQEWMEKALDRDQIRGVIERGAAAGWPGLTYHSELSERYRDHKTEIWNALADDAEGIGMSNTLALIAGLERAYNVHSHPTFVNLLVWHMAERTAREIVDAED